MSEKFQNNMLGNTQRIVILNFCEATVYSWVFQRRLFLWRFLVLNFFTRV